MYFKQMKYHEWVTVMDEEIDALHANEMGDLVPQPFSTNIVTSKWVFRTKFLYDGSLDRYEARLVACGFTQQSGIDFDLTFSHVVKATTVCVVLTIDVLCDRPFHQLDVKNVFLNGFLQETVYMEQPPGYVDSRFPAYVCCLDKALYSLKQALCAWFHRLA